MASATFPALNALPYYDEPATYLVLNNSLFPWEFSGWKRESMSWKTGCYIHAGLSNIPQFNFKGKDVVPFFSSICTNNLDKFPVGSIRHAIMCVESGLIAAHGTLQREAEDEVAFLAAGDWPLHMLRKSQYTSIAPRFVPNYIFQVAGPKSLDTLERAAEESLGDIKFLRFRKAKIAGKTVEVARLGMSGNLALEVRGPMQDAPEVYDAIYKAGRDFGIERLGWRTYLVNHVEGGFPQMHWTFAPATSEDADYQGAKALPQQWCGSIDPANRRARFRTPFELGWQRTVKFDHEFVGRRALELEAANGRRGIVMLRWDADDVVDIYASLLRQGDEYKTIDLPTSPPWTRGVLAHADQVLKDGRDIGVSSGTIYSYYFREVLSMATIDDDCASIGTKVVVRWGDHGGRIKNVRATVERFPYLAENRNSDEKVSHT